MVFIVRSIRAASYRPVRLGFGGISVVRVKSKNPPMLLCKLFLLKQRNILIKYNVTSIIDSVLTEKVKIVDKLLLLNFRKTMRRSMFVIRLVKN